MESLDAIYIINLKFQVKNLEILLPKIPFPKEKIIIFPAVNYANESLLGNITPQEHEITNSPYFRKRPGARGCFLSHYRIYKHIVASKYKLCLILEDDLVFHPHFKKILDNLIESINPKFGITYLQSLEKPSQNSNILDTLHNMNQAFSETNIPLIHHTDDLSYGTPGYLINNANNFTQEFIIFLEDLEFKKKNNYDLPIDSLIGCYFNWFYKTKKLFYYTKKSLVFDTGIFLLQSTTQSNYNLGTYNSYNGMKKLSAKLDRFKSKLLTSSGEELLQQFESIFPDKPQCNILLYQKNPYYLLCLEIIIHSIGKSYTLDMVLNTSKTYHIVLGNTSIPKENTCEQTIFIHKSLEISYLYYPIFDNCSFYQLLKNPEIDLNSLYLKNVTNPLNKKLLGVYSENTSQSQKLKLLQNLDIVNSLSNTKDYNFVILHSKYLEYLIKILHYGCIPILEKNTESHDIFKIINSKRVIFLTPDIKKHITVKNYENLQQQPIFNNNINTILLEKYRNIKNLILNFKK